MRSALGFALVAGLFVSATPAVSASVSDCSHARPDVRIRGCTEIIQSSKDKARPVPRRELVVAYSNRGAAFAEKDNYDRAISDLNEALKLDPEYSGARVNLGIALGRQGNRESAIESFDRAIALNPKRANAYYNRAIAYAAGGKEDHAIRDFDEAIRLRPRDAEAVFHRGIAHERSGDLDRAIADYSAAIKLDARNAAAYFRRGVAYEAAGAPGLALAEYDKALMLDPDDGYACCRRARARDSMAGAMTGALSRSGWFLEQGRDDWRCAVAGISRDDKSYVVAKAWLDFIEGELASRADTGGSQRAPTATLSTPVNPNWSDRTVCILALDAEKVAVGANSRSGVQEFLRRGLSVEKCHAALGLAPAAEAIHSTPPRSVNANWSDRTVCILALDARKETVGPGALPEVQELSRRGLSIDKCRLTLGLPAKEALLGPSADVLRDPTLCVAPANERASWRVEVQGLPPRITSADPPAQPQRASQSSNRALEVRKPRRSSSGNTMAIKPGDD
jgi:tetratricopeptide (TPR) repeat protein